MWESEFYNIRKYLRNSRSKKGVLLVEFWAWTLCAKVVLAIQHLLGCCILWETSQRRSVPVTKFSQSRAWISLKRASAAPQSKECCVIFLIELIIFRSTIQFLFVCYFHYYCVCTNTLLQCEGMQHIFD